MTRTNALLVATVLGPWALACSSPAEPGDGSSAGTTSSGASAGVGGDSGSSGASGGAGAAGNSGSGGASGASAGSSGAAGAGAGGSGPGGELPANSIAATSLGTCAIGNEGQLACWGHYPDMPEEWATPAGAFQSVIVGSFGCAQSATGELSCFFPPGGGESLDDVPATPVGQFDIGVSTFCYFDETETLRCGEMDEPLPEGVAFERVALGRSFGCGIRTGDGGIQCWGDDGSLSADCGTIPPTGHLDPPAGEFVAIESSMYHTCAIRTDGTVACWGAGDATDDPEQVFCDNRINFGQSVAPPGQFKQISVGHYHTCGIRTDDTVACWGAGDEPGDCSGDRDTCGQSVPLPGTFAQVAAGYTHTCAMHGDRTVQCWGSNTGGRSTPPADFP